MHLHELTRAVLERRSLTTENRSVLVGISGIDASGKGFVAKQLATQLENAGRRVALINVDGWLNLPSVRFAETERGEHFYHHALRLEELFSDLILPLKLNRSIELTMDFAEETATHFHPHTYTFHDIDIILLEGIFIFKREFTKHLDLKIWIDCGFETALARAVARSQEGLAPQATIDAYDTIYFPAQRVHFEVDAPIDAADVIVAND